MGQRRRAVRGIDGGLHIAPGLGEAVLADARLQHLQRAENAGEQIIEIVSDAAGELADRLHLLRLAQLVLGAPQRLGGLLLGGDVPADQVDQPVLRRHGPGDPAPGAVLVAEAVLHADGRNALGEPRAPAIGMWRVVGMAQLAHMHRADLVLAPAEHRGPRRVHAEEIAVEIRDAEQVLGDAPDAVALARLLRNLGFQSVVELDQRLFAGTQRDFRAHALGRLHHGGQHAADAAGRGLVRHRAVADGEARVLPFAAAALHPPRQILGEERRTPAGEDILVERPELVIDL